ncbi:hypothetical protein J6590_042583 [Homalodisca vitripennis]|nr:hypothetical protein J6590_042583 [Homalodisca vitripennis]
MTDMSGDRPRANSPATANQIMRIILGAAWLFQDSDVLQVMDDWLRVAHDDVPPTKYTTAVVTSQQIVWP